MLHKIFKSVFVISFMLIFSIFAGCSSGSYDYDENDYTNYNNSSYNTTYDYSNSSIDKLKGYYTDPEKIKDYVFVAYNYKLEHSSDEWAAALLGGFLIDYNSPYYAEYYAVAFAYKDGTSNAYRVKSTYFTQLLQNTISQDRFIYKVEKIDLSSY